MVRVFAFLFALILSPLASFAQIAPGADWTEQRADDGNLYASSPPDELGQYVVLVTGASDPWPADFAGFYAQQVSILTGSLGRIEQRSNFVKLGDPPAPGIGDLHREVFTIVSTEGARLAVALYVYGAGDKLQMFAIVAPELLGLASPDAVLADDKVKELWQEGFVEPASQSTTIPAVPENPPVAGSPASAGAIGEEAVETVVIGSVVKSGGLFITVQVPFLFLKDGRSYQEPEEGPLDFDPGNRPRDSFEPGRWHATASGWKIDYPDGSFYDIDARGRMLPAPAGFRLSGTYKASGGRFGRGWSEKLVFGADGRVASDQLGQVSGESGFGGEFEANSAIANTGTYAINGWTITMPDASGQPKRFLFAMTEGDAPRIICIGYTLYLRQ